MSAVCPCLCGPCWAISEDAEERALSQCYAVTQRGLQQGGNVLSEDLPGAPDPKEGLERDSSYLLHFNALAHPSRSSPLILEVQSVHIQG